MRFLKSIIVLTLLCGAAPLHAATHGLVVGIDDYLFHEQLGGAENDARDMALVLEKIVDGKLRVMVNAEATRAAFDAAWKDIISSAKPNDMIILHFAGHGIKDTDDEAYKDEADGYDEFFLFHAFDEKGPNANEKIRDDELYFLFKAADARGIKILFIADACHSGGLVREVGALGAKKRKGRTKRFTRFQTKVARPAPVKADFKPQPELPDNVVFLGATHEARPVEEVQFEVQSKKVPRGALTYYAARAMEGVADMDRDGTLTAGELIAYLQPNVREKSSNRQIPILIAADKSLPIVTKLEVKTASVETDPRIISLALVDDSVSPKVERARIVQDHAKADIIWNASNGELSNPSGDVLASGVKESGLQGAIDARRLRAFLLDLMTNGHVLGVELLPGDGLYGEGCPVQYRVDAFDHPHFTVINLASNGTIQFLFPLERYSDPVRWTRPGGWSVRTRVSAPFGADFLIFISSEKPLSDLHSELVALNATRDPLKLEAALRRWLPTTKFQIGLKGAFTSSRSKSCGS